MVRGLVDSPQAYIPFSRSGAASDGMTTVWSLGGAFVMTSSLGNSAMQYGPP